MKHARPQVYAITATCRWRRAPGGPAWRRWPLHRARLTGPKWPRALFPRLYYQALSGGDLIYRIPQAARIWADINDLRPEQSQIYRTAANRLTFRRSECLLTSMGTLRMTSDLRRQLILSAAKSCFAHHGFAGTTTKSVAAAASISEALLFKHFPTKSALFAEILAEECEADPAMHELLGLEPSTETLVVLIRGMVRHFMELSVAPDQQDAQRLRLMMTSHLDDGEFAGLIYDKIGGLLGPLFTASLERAVAAGEASRIGREPQNLFWFAHHTVLMTALSQLPAVPCLAYGDAVDLQRQICEFILRGIGLSEAAIASYLGRDLPPRAVQPLTAESA